MVGRGTRPELRPDPVFGLAFVLANAPVGFVFVAAAAAQASLTAPAA
jgi:hypothetical protein